MSKNTIISIAVAAILAGSAGFYGGLTYSKGQTPGSSQFNQRANFRMGMDGTNTNRPNGNFVGGRGQNGGFVSGEIIAADDTSITIKLPDGGSRIVFLSDSTTIAKTAEGVRADLVAGKTVIVTGTANQDGSFTANNVQLRPPLAAPQP